MPPSKKPTNTVDVHRMRGTEKPKQPAPFEDMLPSGLMVKWRMPDPFALVAFDTTLPDPTTQAVIRLLNEEKLQTPDADPRKFRYDAQTIRGLYGLVAHMLEEPKLDASIEYGSNGTLGRREIGFMDVTSLYWLFRIGTRQTSSTPAHADKSPGVADDAPDSDGVRADTSGANGD